MTKISLGESSLVKETFRIAWPTVIESVFIVIVGMLDTYMVSHLGQPAIAGISVATQPKILLYIVFFATNVAISALIARRKGAGKREEVHQMYMTGLVFTFIAGSVLSVLCVIFANPIIQLFGGNEETTATAVLYFRIIIGGMLFNLLMIYTNAALRGCGNTKTTLQTNVVGSLLDLLFNYLLIYGHCGFPEMGVVGAALSNIIGHSVAFAMCIIALCRKDSYIRISFLREHRIGPTRAAGNSLAKMGGNIAGEMILTRIGFAVTAMITARIGTDPYAAHAVGMHFMNLGFAFGDGMQRAAVALIGMSLGAGDIEKAKKESIIAQKMGLCIAVLVVGVLLIFARFIYGFYFDEEYMLDMCMMINCFIAVIMPVQISKVIFNGILRGAEDVKYTLYASAFSVTLVQPVVTYLLVNTMGYGLKGVWISILITQVVQLLCFSIRYKTGKWTEKEI